MGLGFVSRGLIRFGGGKLKELLIAWKDAAPAAGALTAIISALVALIVFHYTRSANRRRATLDMVMKTLLDEGSQQRYSQFKAIIRKHKNPDDCFKIESLVHPSEDNQTDRDLVLNQMNVYELTALGIRRGVFDEAFYKRWFHNQFMTDYESAVDFINGARERKSTLYCECTALYHKWFKNGHPSLSAGRFKMAYWGLLKKVDKIDQARAADRAR